MGYSGSINFDSFSMNKIYDFLTGGVDHAGRTHAFICDQPDEWIESTHDFIRWLFPIADERSRGASIPDLTDEEVEMIKQSEEAQKAMLLSASRMRRFWSKNQHWVTEHDHNHLRITRCIKSLRLLVGDEEAQKMKVWISSVLGPNAKLISKSSLKYWKEA